MGITQLVYPFTFWRTSWLLLAFGDYEQSCCKYLCAGFMWTRLFGWIGEICMSMIAGCMVKLSLCFFFFFPLILTVIATLERVQLTSKQVIYLIFNKSLWSSKKWGHSRKYTLVGWCFFCFCCLIHSHFLDYYCM